MRVTRDSNMGTHKLVALRCPIYVDLKREENRSTRRKTLEAQLSHMKRHPPANRLRHPCFPAITALLHVNM